MIKKITLLFWLLFCLNAAYSQQTFPVNGTSDPRHLTYAFINGTVFIDYKTSFSPATLLIRDGIVVDVGPSIKVPADAIVYDLKGKMIYPSFIDIFSDYGLPEVKKPSRDDNPQLLTSTKGAYNWNQAIRSEYEAANYFSVDIKKAEELKKLGFGTVQSIYRDGIARGTSVLVLLGNQKEHELIIKKNSATNFSLDKGSSTQDYPSSEMGAIALIRQTYLDAKWYAEGGYKKEFNITLEAFNKSQDIPQIFETGDKQQELRAAQLGKEFRKNYIIKGGGDEYERLNEIKETGNAFIVPLNFPEGYDLSDPYEAINISLRQMKRWELAPYNAGMMAKSKIDFALTTADLKNKTDFTKNLRRAITSGLSAEDALKALTFTPAKLLGVEDKIGQLKKGMLANFIITSKNVFDKENTILQNWILGIPTTYHDLSASDIRGNYSIRINDQKPIRLKIGGEMYSPEASVFEDTVAAKANLEFQDNVITFQFELKKTEPKGVYRLTGSYNDSLKNIAGKILLPSGTWNNWVARLDSSFFTPIKPDTTKRTPPGNVFYPNMAFGWKDVPSAKPFLIRNATIWTNENEGILTNADVYVYEGKIKQVGKNITVPEGTQIVDGSGKHLTCGIIDEHSHIAISGQVNESAQSSSAEVRIGDIVDADDIQIYRQLAGGVTISHLLHGSANAIGGQTQIIKLRWGQSPEKLKLENAPRFIKFALGENVKQSHWGDKQVVRFPQTRMGVEQVYTDYFTRAREYAQLRKKYNSTEIKSRAGLIPVRQQLELDALIDIMDKKLFITCHSYVQSEINMLMHVADSFGFKVNTFTHILEGYKVADKMKAHGVSGASSFADWWAYKFEVYEAIPFNGAIMHKIGLNVSFNSDDAEMARRLNQEAAKAVKYGGVKEEDAWKFVTLNPAKMLHIDNRVGSILAGKDADLVLWNENPLSMYAYPLQTYVDGIKYFDKENDAELRKLVTAERQRLMQKMAEAKSKGEASRKPGMSMQEISHCNGSEFILMNKVEKE